MRNDYIFILKGMGRQGFIDQLRALSIFLVVYGHTDEISLFNEYLTTFRIPLFFAISGYISKEKAGINFAFFLKKTFKRLLIPYFVFSLVLFLIWYIREWRIGFNCEYCNPIKNFIGIFYSQGGPDFMAGRGPMWFLTALFCVAMIDFFISQFEFKYKLLLALVLPFVGLMLTSISHYCVPWSLDVAMVAYFFYFLGTVLKRLNFFSLIKGKVLLVSILFFCMHLFFFRFNKPVEFVYKNYGSLPLLLLNGVTGLIWVFSIFKTIPVSPIITWVGRNTLLILVFHLLAKDVVFWILDDILVLNYPDAIPVFLIISALQVIILVPVIKLLNRYFPVLVGLPSQNSQNQ